MYGITDNKNRRKGNRLKVKLHEIAAAFLPILPLKTPAK